MASTFVNIRVHVIFSTAGRRELIRENLRDTLWQYIRGIGRNNGIAIDAVGGMSDHIHLLRCRRNWISPRRYRPSRRTPPDGCDSPFVDSAGRTVMPRSA